MLRRFADLLKSTFRDSDVIGRLGGDEFVVFMTGADEAAVNMLLKRLDAGLEMAQATCRYDYRIEYSVGAVDFDPQRHRTVPDLIYAADNKMYIDKKRRKGL